MVDVEQSGAAGPSTPSEKDSDSSWNRDPVIAAAVADTDPAGHERGKAASAHSKAASDRPNGGAPGRYTSEFERLSDLLRSQEELLELIATEASLDEVLEHIALTIERLVEPALCSIQLIDSTDGSRRSVAAPGLSAEFVEAMDCDGRSPAHDLYHPTESRQARISSSDIEADSRWLDFRDIARKHGLHAYWVQPIETQDGQILGTIALYFNQPYEPADEDYRVVDAMAPLCRFAIRQEERERSRFLADERLVSLATRIPGVVYQRRVTPEGDIRYTYISEGAKELFGVSAEEILADPEALFDCHGPQYRADFRERLLEASRELTLWDVEAQIITANGEEKWIHAIARPQRQPDGSVLWNGVILDATRIKQAEFELRKTKEAAEQASRAQAELLEKLRGANERFASTAATIPGVVYQRRVTPEGDIRYTYISEGAKELFGVSAEEILTDPEALFDCHGPQYRADFRERLLEASRELTLWDVEAQIITRDGEEKWTHAIARPQRQPDGSVLWDGIILDATRIKQAEFELRKAKDVAERSSRAKTEFLAQMSHELRTPLNAIIGFSEILRNVAPEALGREKCMDYANDIHSSGVDLLTTINDILEFTKLETGEYDFLENEVVLERVIDAAFRQAAQVAERAQIQLATPVMHCLPVVLGDQDKIRRIVAILLSNAIKFTPQGGGVQIIASDDDAKNVVISVLDTGIGIAAKDMPKVFEVFGQVDCELSRRYEGVGLGIPLAAALARLHDAAIEFESEIGVGTKARLIIPSHRVLGHMVKAASA